MPELPVGPERRVQAYAVTPLVQPASGHVSKVKVVAGEKGGGGDGGGGGEGGGGDEVA